MNVVGIIAEYNPMHNGHIYNIQKAKEITNADYVIVIMSGSFTEQGNVAVIDKFSRASIAIENGADMVVELPTIYATSSAENFAFGAVNILNNLGVVTHLAFGTEDLDIFPLKEVATTYLEHKKEIIDKIKTYSKQGITSAEAYSLALHDFLPNASCNFSLPNNILAIEYIKSLLALKSKIKAVSIHRQVASHSDDKIAVSCEYASSTSIRNVLSDTNLSLTDKLNNIQNVVPKNTIEYIKNNKCFLNKDLWNFIKFEIIKLNTDGLKNIHEVTEGLENKLYKQALICNSYDEFIHSIKSKRYTLSKIKRICVYILLGITKEKYSRLKNVSYARVLKVSEKSLPLLSLLCDHSSSVITKITDDILANLQSATAESIKLDILANNLFYTANIDYINKIIQP